jgi:hypothetical protein
LPHLEKVLTDTIKNCDSEITQLNRDIPQLKESLRIKESNLVYMQELKQECLAFLIPKKS